MHWWNDGWSWWNWALMTTAMLAFWAFVAWAVVMLVRSPDRAFGDARRSPEQILAERFAAGEIDAEEYHRRLEALRSSDVPAR